MPDASSTVAIALPVEIVDAYQAGTLVVVVGPDASVAAGLWSRRELARALLGVARERGRPVEACAAIEARIERDVPEAMSALRRELDEPTVRAHVERAFDDRGLQPSALHHAVAALGERVDRMLTVNLDRLLDRALPPSWARLPEVTTQTRGQRRALLKLHGTLGVVDTWRLTSGRVDELRKSEAVRGLMEGAFREQTLLLVGFDAHAAELDALLDLAGAPKDATDVAVAHVALVSEGVDEPRRVALADRGVRLVSVGAEGLGYVEATARMLHELVPGAEVPKPSVTSAGARLLEVGAQASPFPGLLPFTEELGEFFHGRSDEVQVALSMLGGPGGLEHTRWLLIEGQSGVGKSSFVQAGLLPALRARGIAGGPSRLRVGVLRPGQLPLQALARAVAGVWASKEVVEVEAEALQAGLEERDDALATYVGRRLEEDEGLLLVVDQLEEAVTFAAASHRGPFAAALATALRYSTGRLYLVTTLRSDYVGHLAEELPRLAERSSPDNARPATHPGSSTRSSHTPSSRNTCTLACTLRKSSGSTVQLVGVVHITSWSPPGRSRPWLAPWAASARPRSTLGSHPWLAPLGCVCSTSLALAIFADTGESVKLRTAHLGGAAHLEQGSGVSIGDGTAGVHLEIRGQCFLSARACPRTKTDARIPRPRLVPSVRTTRSSLRLTWSLESTIAWRWCAAS